jgi:hypothetical protein
VHHGVFNVRSISYYVATRRNYKVWCQASYQSGRSRAADCYCGCPYRQHASSFIRVAVIAQTSLRLNWGPAISNLAANCTRLRSGKGKLWPDNLRAVVKRCTAYLWSASSISRLELCS